MASALLAILAAGDHDRVEYKVSNLPENDPTMLGDELVVRRVTENGYIFDDNIGCTRLTGNAYLQDGRDGQTSVPGFRGPHLLKFTHWDKEPYLAVLEVQTLRDEVDRRQLVLPVTSTIFAGQYEVIIRYGGAD